MGKITGFLEFEREKVHKQPVPERLRHWREFEERTPDDVLRRQGARCMDCGIPFCHKGCPLGNIIPDWNDLVYRGRWREAIDRLHSTNNFPEFTGRICPAPCEEACVLNINDNPVTIKNIEKHIIDHAWDEGWVAPLVAPRKTGKRVAVVGSGPAGMACAQQLARAGDRGDGQILATGKRVVILGGGDTGSDCLGTSNRQGAVSVHQFELLPEPPKDRPPLVWPNWPMILRSSSSHEEGVIRDFSINTKAFLADAKGRVRALRAVRLDWQTDNGRPVMKERPGSEFELPCEFVLLALGFLGPETGTVISQLGCELTERGNVKAGPDYQTTVPGVFACGDARRGQSLVVWAIWEGREAARGVDAYLMGETFLPASPEL